MTDSRHQRNPEAWWFVLAPLVLCALLLYSACSEGGPPVPAAKQLPKVEQSAPVTESEEDRVILAVAEAVKRNRLITVAEECVSYNFDATPKDYYVVDVRENHRNPKCGGDPNTAPRLFSVRVSRTSGGMSTDAGTGQFRPIAVPSTTNKSIQ